MNADRTGRRRAITALLRAEAVSSQEEVTERLLAEGFAVTQATVSRDLERLGAVKVKRDGVLRYALPDQIAAAGDWAGSRLASIVAEWVTSVEAAGPLIVLRTPPATAHLVGIAIDQARPREIAGTIAGDDTLFVAVRDGFAIGDVVSLIDAMRNGN